jgi:hypothetical protein
MKPLHFKIRLSHRARRAKPEKWSSQKSRIESDQKNDEVQIDAAFAV